MPPEDDELELPPEEELPEEELLLEELELPPEDELLEELEEELEEEPKAGGLVSEPPEPPPQAANSADTAIAVRLERSLCCMNTPIPGF